jgi:EAL domain-containing protein (putative c-di-GMP-specific phosphodiesterase class I)
MDEKQIQYEDDVLITNDVARAIEEGELVAYFHPMMDIESNSVVAAEALVRWTLKDGTIVPAGLFVPSLERTHTIEGLDWVMAELVSSFLEATGGGMGCVPISLNLSDQHATDDDFAERLLSTLEWHGVDSVMVRAEFNAENLLSAEENLKTIFRTLVEHGFIGTVDEFLSGPRELKELHDLGVTVVKITNRCWRGKSEEELRKLVEAAASLDMIICPEGVEEAHEVEVLRQAGFSLAQGFYFAKPMSEKDFLAYCAAH